MARWRSIASTLLAASACAATASAAHAQADDGAEAAVIEAVDAFFRAFAARDAEALGGLMLEEGYVRALRQPADGPLRVRATPSPDWAAGSADDSSSLREVYWDPVIQIRGPMASFWAPYEVFIDGETYQCGVDLLTLVKTEAGWRIADLTYTSEPDACAELRPDSAGAIRPADLARGD